MTLTHLQRLEAESIHIMREVVAECEQPGDALLDRQGQLGDAAPGARRRSTRRKPPFPLLHVDTTWKFREMYEFRERMAARARHRAASSTRTRRASSAGINPFDHGSAVHTDMWKTEGLKQALDKHGFDAAFGGARRDEEKSRAKERVFSFRSAQHRWDPKSQRPELWRLYNARKHKGESIRVFPLSNWTELDVWQYIHLEDIPIVPLYFAGRAAGGRARRHADHGRRRPHAAARPARSREMRSVRFRTLGCYPLTGAVESDGRRRCPRSSRRCC